MANRSGPSWPWRTGTGAIGVARQLVVEDWESLGWLVSREEKTRRARKPLRESEPGA